ncbi:MAG: VOC family protein [Pseudomonadota bacterium]
MNATAQYIQPATNLNTVNPLEFPTELRPKIAIKVSNLKRSKIFYHALFNRRATIDKDKTAHFRPYNPSVDLILQEDATAQARDGHFGIQLKSTQDIERYKKRITEAGFSVITEEAETACCYSVSNKAWVNDPDGNQWEVFVVTGENSSDVRCGDSCACEAGGCD